MAKASARPGGENPLSSDWSVIVSYFTSDHYLVYQKEMLATKKTMCQGRPELADHALEESAPLRNAN